MRKISNDKIFDLEKVIKKSKKRVINKRKWDKMAETNYIIEKFIKESGLNITKKDLQNAIIRTSEKTKSQKTNTNGLTLQGTKETKDFYMLSKLKLIAIKQCTLYVKSNHDKKVMRDISVLNENDLINEQLLTEDLYLNEENPIVKKLITKNKQKKSTK